MLQISDLLRVADLYRTAAAVERESTLSYRVFGDNKRLTSIRAGQEITVGRFNNAMTWFAARWPETEPMPDILRPYIPSSSSEAAA